MKVFQIVGVRRSGKTATVEALIKELKSRGHRVGTVKCIGCPAFTLDNRKNSNTVRHREAGADLVVVFGPREVDFVFPRQLDLDHTFGIMAAEGLDYCIMEGGYGYDLPRIVCFRDPREIPERITPKTFALSGAGTGTGTEGQVPAAQTESHNLPIDDGDNACADNQDTDDDDVALAEHGEQTDDTAPSSAESSSDAECTDPTNLTDLTNPADRPAPLSQESADLSQDSTDFTHENPQLTDPASFTAFSAALPHLSAFEKIAELADLIESVVPHVTFPIGTIPRPESCRQFCQRCTHHRKTSDPRTQKR